MTPSSYRVIEGLITGDASREGAGAGRGRGCLINPRLRSSVTTFGGVAESNATARKSRLKRIRLLLVYGSLLREDDRNV